MKKLRRIVEAKRVLAMIVTITMIVTMLPMTDDVVLAAESNYSEVVEETEDSQLESAIEEETMDESSESTATDKDEITTEEETKAEKESETEEETKAEKESETEEKTMDEGETVTEQENEEENNTPSAGSVFADATMDLVTGTEVETTGTTVLDNSKFTSDIKITGKKTNNSDVKRYVVLVLDTSNSTDFYYDGKKIYTVDTAIEYVKKASSRFLTSISKASGDNYVAVVYYKNTAKTLSDFSNDYDNLTNDINTLTASSNTRDISSGLAMAQNLLSNIEDENTIKNIVLFTTGMTNEGGYNYSGHYNENTVGSNWYRMDTRVKLYAYANNAYEQAKSIKENKIDIYSIGLFQPMLNMPQEGQDIAKFFELTALDLATSVDYFYPVNDVDKLEFTFGEVADDILKVKKIDFTYQSNKDYTATCYYSNDYFSQSAYTYNPSLATMSISYAMSAFGSADGGQTDYSNKSKNAKKLLMNIGVPEENINTNDWFTEKPTTDSIGVIAGNMPITIDDKDYTLIAVAVRGGGYEQEWASNFTIGTSGQHDGFNTAKDNVLSFLRNYISEQKITGPVKLWITGYSRAAATANLVAGEIDNGASLGDDITYENDDVYAYCFETPAGALASEVKNKTIYYNIFNIINSSDPVPYVAPAAMGFGRYGYDHYLPWPGRSDYATLRKQMLEVYNSLPSTEAYIVDNFQMKKLGIFVGVEDDTKNDFSQAVFLNNYITIVSKDFFKNRDNYVKYYQDEIREICSVMFGCTDEQSEILMNSIISQAKDEWKSLAWSYVWNTGIKIGGSEADALQIISNWLNNAIKEAGITNYSEEMIDAAGKDLADLMLALITNHPNYFTTAVMNGSRLAAAHYPELCYSWLASADVNYNYTDGVKDIFNNGGYRIVRINCEVDVNVYDSNGATIASIINETPQNVNEDSYIFGVDEDGQKYVVLQSDGDYKIEITGRENDSVNLGIVEYSALAGDFTRNVNYFNVKLNKGETLTGIIPSYNEEEIENDTLDGSTADYTLLASDGTPIHPDSDLSGEKATNAYFNVTVTSSNSEYGIVTGFGLRPYGQFAQLQATALEGYKFVGWYENNTCVSVDETYRVCVTKDISLVAEFDIDDSSDGVLFNDIPSDGIPDGLWIAGIQDYTYTGKAIKPEVRVYDGDKRLRIGQDYTISYKNNTKVNDASNASVAPTIVVKGKGNYSGTETATFKILPVNLSDSTIVVDDITLANNNKVQKVIPTVSYNGKKLSNKKDFTVSYPDEGVDAYKAEGTYRILLTAKENGNFTGTRTVQLFITNNKLISKANVKKILDQVYTGNAIEPEPTVTLKNDKLVKGIDYIVSYEKNIEPGIATVAIIGIGKYSGTKKVTFKIMGVSLKQALASGIENKTYNGVKQKQNFKVTLGDKTLIEGTDYTVVYSNNTNVGKATVTIKGINAYSGVLNKTFMITPYDLKENPDNYLKGLDNEIIAKYVKGSTKPKLELTFRNRKLIEGTDYTVTYKNNKVITTDGTNKKPTFTIVGKGNFKGSLIKDFSITSKALNDAESAVTMMVPDIPFVDKAGKYISKPVLTDTNGQKLVVGKDYEIDSYTLNNGTVLTKKSKVSADTNVKVKVKGIGTYTGELEAVYKITKNDFSKAKISILSQTYTGKSVILDKNDINVKIGSTKLTYGIDFEIKEGSYTNNVKKGKATVTIIGKGNYAGMKTVNFRIVPKKLLWFWRIFG